MILGFFWGRRTENLYKETAVQGCTVVYFHRCTGQLMQSPLTWASRKRPFAGRQNLYRLLTFHQKRAVINIISSQTGTLLPNIGNSHLQGFADLANHRKFFINRWTISLWFAQVKAAEMALVYLRHFPAFTYSLFRFGFRCSSTMLTLAIYFFLIPLFQTLTVATF